MLLETNVFNAPVPGTTLRTITEEWNVLSGFHTLMRQRMKLEAEHLLRLRQFQDSIDSTWSNSGAWALISPIVDLWSSQMNILENSSKTLLELVEACPTEPSPDEPVEDVLPSSKYVPLHDSYKAYQECQTAASSTEAIAQMRQWFKRNSDKKFHEALKPLPAIDRKYRESVVAQRNTLQPIAEWHSKTIPKKLDAHVRHSEGMQACLRDYLVESSRLTSELVISISTAQKRLAEFSSLALIDPSQRCFENESTYPAFQPAVYLSHYLGGVPAEPVLGVQSYLPKLTEIGKNDKYYLADLSVENILKAEKENTNLDETIQWLRMECDFAMCGIAELALGAVGPLLPISNDAIQRYQYGIKRGEIAQQLKPFPIENCRMAFTIMTRMDPSRYRFTFLAGYIIGSYDAGQLLRDIWRKWDFESHRPLPREVVRTLLKWNVRTKKVEGGELVFVKTGLPYEPSQ